MLRFTKTCFTVSCLLIAICLAAVGTLSKKELDLNPKRQIILPLTIGLLLFFGSIFFYSLESNKVVLPYTTLSDLAYIATSLVGAVLAHTALDNISKLIKSGLGKDEWTDNLTYRKLDCN